MKKFAKHALALACVLPFAFSATACSSFPEVAETDRESVYTEYATKYENALAALSEKDFFLNYYVSQISTAEQGAYASSTTATAEMDADVSAGKVSRAATTVKTTETVKSGDTEESSSQNTFTYTLADGTYQKTEQRSGDETTEEKSFTASETPSNFELDGAFLALPDFATLTAGGEVTVYADANGQGMRFEYVLSETGGNYDGLDCTGLETKEETTYAVTVRFDYAGNLLSIEAEMISRFTATAPQTSEPEQGGAEMMSDVQTTLPPNAKGYQRIYFKTTLRNASTVKVPTAKELETYKQ